MGRGSLVIVLITALLAAAISTGLANSGRWSASQHQKAQKSQSQTTIELSSAPAQFNREGSVRYYDWEAVLYRNINGNRLFCAVETYAGDETVLRIVKYKDTGETFIEVHNVHWNLIEGQVSFTLSGIVQSENYDIELRGRSWGDSYTHDFTTERDFLLVLGFIMQASSIEIKNSNGTKMVKFSGNDSSSAISSFRGCIDANL